MEIVRDGKPIELTAAELEEAYRERKADYLKMDLQIRTGNDVSDRLVDLFDSLLCKNDGYWESYWLTADLAIERYKSETEFKGCL